MPSKKQKYAQANTAGPTSVFPSQAERPVCCNHPTPVQVGNVDYPAGVYYHTIGDSNGKKFPIDDWVCAPLEVSAKTANREDVEYGRLLKFSSSNHQSKKWSMPCALLASDNGELLHRLYDEGLEIAYRHRKRVAEYISAAQPSRFLRCATHTGWHSATTFVLPDEVIGPADIWFQSTRKIAAYAKAGDFERWKQLVAARATGNPFLLFALSFGLCGPLLERLNFPGAGVHLYGDTTMGKTTTLEAAASCWGQGANYLRAWRATANGMEGTCVQHTDTLLVLDEVGEINPRELDEVAYFLVNGQGKTRSNRYGEARPVQRWRVALLSSGEHSIKSKLAGGNITAKEGQLLRIIDVPSNGHFGLFDTLHGFSTGAGLADAIRAASDEQYGHAGPAFVKVLIGLDAGELAVKHAEIANRFTTSNSQEARAARIFALAALAGELVTDHKLVPWKPGDATSAAVSIFDYWRSARETSGLGTEHFEILRHISDFIDAHGDSRFSDLNWVAVGNQSEPLIRQRAGYWDDSGPSRIYLFTNGALREATKGHDFNRVLKALEDAGALVKTGANAKSVTTRTPDNRTPRLYWIDPEKLESK